MTRIKLCGLTRIQDIEIANKLAKSKQNTLYQNLNEEFLKFRKLANKGGNIDV